MARKSALRSFLQVCFFSRKKCPIYSATNALPAKPYHRSFPKDLYPWAWWKIPTNWEDSPRDAAWRRDAPWTGQHGCRTCGREGQRMTSKPRAAHVSRLILNPAIQSWFARVAARGLASPSGQGASRLPLSLFRPSCDYLPAAIVKKLALS